MEVREAGKLGFRAQPCVSFQRAKASGFGSSGSREARVQGTVMRLISARQAEGENHGDVAAVGSRGIPNVGAFGERGCVSTTIYGLCANSGQGSGRGARCFRFLLCFVSCSSAVVWAHGCRRRTAYVSTTIDRVVRDDWDGVPICCNFCAVVRGCGQISIVNLWILDHNGNMVSWTRCEVSLGFVSGCRGLVALFLRVSSCKS